MYVLLIIPSPSERIRQGMDLMQEFIKTAEFLALLDESGEIPLLELLLGFKTSLSVVTLA